MIRTNRRTNRIVPLLLLSLIQQTISNDDIALRPLKRLRRTLMTRDMLDQQPETLGIDELLTSQGWTIELENENGTYAVADVNTTSVANFETEKDIAIQKGQVSNNQQSR